jgi:hypothetical protein
VTLEWPSEGRHLQHRHLGKVGKFFFFRVQPLASPPIIETQGRWLSSKGLDRDLSIFYAARPGSLFF